jgi:hypothetical protein
MPPVNVVGEPDAGNPHVRFDEGVQETCARRAARLCSTLRLPPCSDLKIEMRGPEEPIVFQHAYDLTRWYSDRTAGFPKPHRFTLGDRVQETLLDLLAVLQDAAYRKRRADSLARAQDHVDRLRLWNRLARDLRCISPRQYAYAAERIEEIGRQVGGWSRSPSGRMDSASATDGTTRPVPAGRGLERQSNQLSIRVPQRRSTDEPEHEQRLPGGGAQDSHEVR